MPLRYSGDRNVPERKLARVYDRNAGYWDSRLYRLAYHPAYVRLLDGLKREGLLPGPLRVLDCGTGAGLLIESFLDLGPAAAEIHAIDLSPNLLAMARAKFLRRGVPARLALSSISRLPYPEARMDLVLGGLVLEHVPEPLDAVREMARVLRPGRPLVLVATRRGAPDHWFRLKYGYSPYPKAALLGWLKQAGLTRVRAQPLYGIARLFARAYVGVKP